MLSIKNLSTFYYTDSKIIRAVDNVNLDIHDGEFIGLAGPSGCGKSTLGLSILRLIEKPGKIINAKILLDGVDLLKLTESEMNKIRGAKISCIFQDPFTSLNPVITIGEQISETIRIHFEKSKNAADKEALDLLRKVKIDNPDLRFRQFPHELSGGIRQRIMIAIAISCGSKFLIADEPTTALDVTTQAHIMSLLKKLNEEDEISILLISHNIRLIKKYCGKMYEMEKGKLG